MGKQQRSFWEDGLTGFAVSTKPRTVHTSKSHPLDVDWLSKELVGCNGRVGMTFAPGKCNEKGVTGIHRRSMEQDMAKLVAVKTGAVVTLMEPTELVENSMGGIEIELTQRKIAWVHCPIRDLSIPTSLRSLRDAIKTTREYLTAGNNVVVHCRGGHGRTGLFVACLLADVGHAPGDAIKLVRAARKGTIHNVAQADFVHLYANELE